MIVVLMGVYWYCITPFPENFIDGTWIEADEDINHNQTNFITVGENKVFTTNIPRDAYGYLYKDFTLNPIGDITVTCKATLTSGETSAWYNAGIVAITNGAHVTKDMEDNADGVIFAFDIDGQTPPNKFFIIRDVTTDPDTTDTSPYIEYNQPYYIKIVRECPSIVVSIYTNASMTGDSLFDTMAITGNNLEYTCMNVLFNKGQGTVNPRATSHIVEDLYITR